ncbi:MAG: (2Fe-2S)-binding protein [Deltaproteobacteria bacterium]|nr:(2Fe-2S)-binding protein [Deltaproteobacteria bacterium]
MAGEHIAITVTVNGEDYREEVPATRSLLDFLRDDLALTGTKEGCGEGECGACSVILDGRLVDACLVFAAEADGRRVETIEGLAEGGELHPLQRAFAAAGAAQCGYCTPGMLMACKALLDGNPSPTRDEAAHGIAGNLCRCTGYGTIVQAVMEAAEES